MSDAQNLNDFLFQQTKNKKKKRPAAVQATQQPASAAANNAEEEKKAAAENSAANPSTNNTNNNEEVKATTPTNPPDASPTTVPPRDNFADDSSDDEANQIVFADNKTIDRKELEKKRKKDAENEQTDAAAGWGGFRNKLNQQEGESGANNAPTQTLASQAKGPQQPGQINFKGGKPTFTRRPKGIMGQDEFPDLDIAAATSGQGGNASSEPTASKANNSAAMYNMFSGAQAKGPRAEGEVEEQKRPQKPVFRGKANFGGASQEEIQNSRQNYDMSKFSRASAAVKREPRPEGEGGGEQRQGGDREGRPRQEHHGGDPGGGASSGGMGGMGGENRRGPAQATASRGFDDDDGFEVVTDKKKSGQRRNFGEPTFGGGGGPPTFTRGGGKNREQ